MTAPTIRTELAAAIRRLNVAFAQLPEAAQDAVASDWGGIDAPLDAALKGERDAALVAIEKWERDHLVAFEAAR